MRGGTPGRRRRFLRLRLRNRRPPSPSSTPTPASADLAARVRGLWPDEPLIQRRVAALAAGEKPRPRVAVEYAVARRARTLAYAVKTRERWAREGYTLTECQEEVRAQAAHAAAGATAGPPGG